MYRESTDVGVTTVQPWAGQFAAEVGCLRPSPTLCAARPARDGSTGVRLLPACGVDPIDDELEEHAAHGLLEDAVAVAGDHFAADVHFVGRGRLNDLEDDGRGLIEAIVNVLESQGLITAEHHDSESNSYVWDVRRWWPTTLGSACLVYLEGEHPNL